MRLPWSAEPAPDWGSYILQADGEIINNSAIDDENAEFIVTCVNAYESLLKGLARYGTHLRDCIAPLGCDCGLAKLWSDLESSPDWFDLDDPTCKQDLQVQEQSLSPAKQEATS